MSYGAEDDEISNEQFQNDLLQDSELFQEYSQKYQKTQVRGRVNTDAVSGKSDSGLRGRKIGGIAQRKLGGLNVESKTTLYPTFAEFNASVDGDGNNSSSQDPQKLQVNSAKLAGEKNKLGARSKKVVGELKDDNIKPFEKRDRLRAKSPNPMLEEQTDVVVVKK